MEGDEVFFSVLARRSCGSEAAKPKKIGSIRRVPAG